MGALLLQTEENFGQMFYRDLFAKTLGADGVILAETTLRVQPEKNTVPLPRVPLMQGSSQKCRAAGAAFRVTPAPQKPVCPAARFAPQRRGQRVQETGGVVEMFLDILSNSYEKESY